MNNNLTLAFMEMCLEHIPANVFLKDKKGRYLEVNHHQVINYGLKKPQEIIKFCDHDLLEQEQDATLLRKNDLAVISSDTPLVVQEKLLSFDGEGYISCKYPFYLGRKLIGVFGIAFKKSTQRNVGNALGLSSCGLKPQEQKFLVELLKGLTVAKASEKLYRSKKTGDDYILSIRRKWNCHTKSEVIQEAYQRGYFDIHLDP